jgi:hypothetical protein
MAPGDILMVSRDMTDKKTGKPFTWRFLALVLRTTKRRSSRIGGQLDLLRLDTGADMSLDPRDDRWDIRLIDEDNWPDGARVLRMRAILEGRLDEVI